MLDKFEKAAMEAIEKALQEVNAGAGNKITHVLNAEYNMGRFSALMEIIEGINIERFADIGEKTQADRDRILKFIDTAYHK